MIGFLDACIYFIFQEKNYKKTFEMAKNEY